ncbi:hypothetical protein ACYRFS_12775 [Listeria kieliensis]
MMKNLPYWKVVETVTDEKGQAEVNELKTNLTKNQATDLLEKETRSIKEQHKNQNCELGTERYSYLKNCCLVRLPFEDKKTPGKMKIVEVKAERFSWLEILNFK